MSGTDEKQSHDATAIDTVDPEIQERNIHQSNVLANKELMNNAFNGENQEHAMGPWEAARTHPMACFWAFFMCFTIVSPRVR
jgi:MFS transporter, SP family, general alpha glucoside:H+ symporter